MHLYECLKYVDMCLPVIVATFLINFGLISFIMLYTLCIKNGANILVTGIYTVYKQTDGIVSACNRLTDEIDATFKDGFNMSVY